MQSGGASTGEGSGYSEENDVCESHITPKTSYNRHTTEQIQVLEGFFKKCPHPNDKQRRELGMELGMEPRQVKFWFQNKRTQTKTQTERADNSSLRNENDRFRCENIAYEEALRNSMCGNCGPCSGPPVSREGQIQIRHQLEKENIELKCEYERLSSMLANYMGRPLSAPTFHMPYTGTANKASGNPVFKSDSLIANIDPKKGLADQTNANPELEKLVMSEIASHAMDELILLLKLDHPLWIKSPTEDQYVLDYDCYCKIVSKPAEFRYVNSRMESSKDSAVVAMNAKLLVDLYLDPEKWVDLFPTVFPQAKNVRVIKAGLLENRSDSLQLVHEKMHVLSPLLPERDFYLLRYCQQTEAGAWVIVDVSIDRVGASHAFPTFCWKNPSGCRIEEMPNGLSKVTYVERVEVDDNFAAHPIYEDLVKSTLAFGAKRWITTLQRTCERNSFLKEASRFDNQLGKGRRGMIMLASNMIKTYCSIFKSFGAADFTQLAKLTNGEVQISVDKSTTPDQPVGIIIKAAASFGVPASPERVFDFLNNYSTRAQWDVLCNGSQVHEVMQIPTGRNSSNLISILQPSTSSEKLMIFQETAVEHLESFLVFAPVDTPIMLELATGAGSPCVPILASGFAITPDGPDRKAAPSTSAGKPRSGGSVITAGFQMLGSTSPSVDDVNSNLVPMADAYVAQIVRVIKSAFKCSD